MVKKIVPMQTSSLFKKCFCENTDLLRDFLENLFRVPNNTIGPIKILKYLTDDANRIGICLHTTIGDRLSHIEMEFFDEETRGRKAAEKFGSFEGSEIDDDMSFENMMDRQRILIEIYNFYNPLHAGFNDYDPEKRRACWVKAFPDAAPEFIRVACDIWEDGYLMKLRMPYFDANESNDIYVIELLRVDKNIDVNNPRKIWMQLLAADSEERLNELSTVGSDAIQKMVQVVHTMLDSVV